MLSLENFWVQKNSVQKHFVQRNFGSKKFWITNFGPNNSGSYNKLGVQKDFLSKKMFRQKNSGSKNFSKNNFQAKKVWVQDRTIYGSSRFWAKNLLVYTNFLSKNNWSKVLGPKNFCLKNCGSKKFEVKQNLGPKIRGPKNLRSKKFQHPII